MRHDQAREVALELLDLTRILDEIHEENSHWMNEHEVRSLGRGIGFLRVVVRSLKEETLV
jgi:hypothetical protein